MGGVGEGPSKRDGSIPRDHHGVSIASPLFFFLAIHDYPLRYRNIIDEVVIFEGCLEMLKISKGLIDKSWLP